MRQSLFFRKIFVIFSVQQMEREKFLFFFFSSQLFKVVERRSNTSKRKGKIRFSSGKRKN